MRLLNTKTLKLEEFWDANHTPPYAILSHTWEKEEVSFQAIADLESAAQLIGFSKIQACCNQALTDGYEWVWIDTCCIDKSSSAELSEAINSMFGWYKKSAICYAYLADVPSNGDPQVPRSAFSKSRWFTRGWTLQELIAPNILEFFSNDWKKLGSRRSLSARISQITKIDFGVLALNLQPQRKSIAQRMSWASRRSTTRIEDIAYCLIGLFAVNMPLLYGEGERAFIRLQEEILKRSNDHSLFAWTEEKTSASKVLGGLLASSPSSFAHSNSCTPLSLFSGSNLPFSMTNLGLRIELPIFHVPQAPQDEFIAVLGCISAVVPGTTCRNARIGLCLHLNPSDNPNFGFQSINRARALRDVKRSSLILGVQDCFSLDGKDWVELKVGRAGVTTLFIAQEDNSI